MLQTPHKIVSLGQSAISHKEDGRRIEVLAHARNAALEPLYSGEAAKHIPGGKFMEMLFMNDIYFCAMDILEVIYQKQMQGANQACAMDWGVGQVIYDRWVLRTTGGRLASLHWLRLMFCIRVYSVSFLFSEKDILQL